ncbi:MAG: deoxyribodipyrimidine photo-lyase [Woeseiaceae bacterium]|nr:deoxyribodipyrimidine photo-lyase [Woeseiaceae bacterium]
MSSERPTIVWFRQDLRLADNPAWHAATMRGGPILPLYILDDGNAGAHRPGAASRWWLHRSLNALNGELGGFLHVRCGHADDLLPRIVAASGAGAVYWNRCYEPWRIRRDKGIREHLKRDGLQVRSFNGSLLYEPAAIAKDDGSPYRVFTPYWRNGCLAGPVQPRDVLPRPEKPGLMRMPGDAGLTVDALGLLPGIHWYKGIEAEWRPGERGARQRLDAFVEQGIAGYRQGRDRPDLPHVSRLSPHLHFGEISPHQVREAVLPLAETRQLDDDVDAFLSELGWREFSYYLLYHWPAITHENLQRKFDRFPWRDDPGALDRWQRGQTGYPIVDAGMRELWRTGYMHNRVRMVTASFLVKNLMQHWHHGEAWFRDTLVDADLASNSVSWQWVAGSGADAAPYFRIFNPVTQGTKFDPAGDYVRQYVPEIAGLPDRYLQAPWTAPPDVLAAAGVTLGDTYPGPVVDLKASRARALAAFKSLTPAV